MTWAKMNLTIHLNGKYFNDFTAESLKVTDDKNIYLPPDEFTLHLNHKDVWVILLADISCIAFGKWRQDPCWQKLPAKIS
jgi:hypothetical protein